MNRRKFIGQGAFGLGAMLALSQLPIKLDAKGIAKYKHPIGFQSFAIRDLLAKDFAGTMKMMADMGYESVEMCYPPGYAQYGFGPLVGIKATDMRHMIEDAGLHCPSSHFLMGDLRGDALYNSIEFAHDLGMKQMICPGLDVPGTAISQYKEAAGEFNKIAEKIKSAGMKTGLHNHTKEFAVLDDELIYEAIMGALDGNLVKMQFQTEVITLGYKASTYFNKYPGRFISAHLSDWTTDKKAVPIGQGIIDWKEFFETAKTGGVQNFFVEMPLETLKDSATYIHGLLG
ncbi:MAG TPA: TIM barrel protein [Mucilaginibacter sp.]|jgi:sugar phosphate isomerase/epimerase